MGYGKLLKTHLSTCLLIICERIIENKAFHTLRLFKNLGQSRFVSEDRCINVNICGVDAESIRAASQLILPLRVGVARTEGGQRRGHAGNIDVV